MHRSPLLRQREVFDIHGGGGRAIQTDDHPIAVDLDHLVDGGVNERRQAAAGVGLGSFIDSDFAALLDTVSGAGSRNLDLLAHPYQVRIADTVVGGKRLIGYSVLGGNLTQGIPGGNGIDRLSAGG